MRAEQFARLQALQEKLTDVFLRDADPDSWAGAGQTLSEMTKETRGDSYWCRKNAAATLSVLMRTTNLIGVIQMRSDPGRADAGGVPAPEQDKEEDTLDADVRSAEKEANRLLAKMQTTMKSHGKA